MADPARIVPLFSVPSVLATHPQADTLNPQLRQLFLAREAEGQRHRNNTATMDMGGALFESTFRLFDWPDACIKQLRDYCWATLYGAIGELNGYDQKQLSQLHINADAWFHITRKSGYFGLHNHPMASWSGVYCVDAGTDDGMVSDSGVLNFQHPNPLSSMFLDMAVANLKPPYNGGGRRFRLRPGQLVLFPSWVMHQVMPFQGQGERITVAFNAWFQYQGEINRGAIQPR